MLETMSSIFTGVRERERPKQIYSIRKANARFWCVTGVAAAVSIRLRCLIRSDCNYLKLFRRALLRPSSGRTITNLTKLNDNLFIFSSTLFPTFNFFGSNSILHTFFVTEAT